MQSPKRKRLGVYSIITGNHAALRVRAKWSDLVVRLRCVAALLTFHVQSDSFGGVALGTNTVDRLLHLAVAAVSSLHGIRRGGQELVVQEGEGFLQVGREQFLQRLSDSLETPDATPELSQLLQGGVATTAAVEEAVNFVHNISKSPQFALAPGDANQGTPLGGSKDVLHEQIAMLKQLPDFLLDPLAFRRRLAPATEDGRPRKAGLVAANSFRILAPA